MTAREMGLLLLCSSLGDAKRHPLTLQRLRELEQAMLQAPRPLDQLAQVEEAYLRNLGFGAVVSCHMVRLLQQEEQAKAYLARAKAQGIACLTRLSPGYPRRLLETLGSDAPAVLWVKGNLPLLQTDCVSVVGSREIHQPNRTFAWEAGKQIARQGFTLVTGGARGADRAAEQGCASQGGSVIVVLPGAMTDRPVPERGVLCAEDSFDAMFSAQRALSRNRMIHAWGRKVLVAQAASHAGGTWAGTAENLRRGWSPVFQFADGSEAAQALGELGAMGVGMAELAHLDALMPDCLRLEQV